MTAKEHYDRHLAKIYSWMLGDFNQRVQEQKSMFTRYSIRPGSNAVAFDLGAGHGIQSVALANIGFTVVAVDFSQHLLTELQKNSQNLPIETKTGDIEQFLNEVTQQPELIICMGDTLTHFPDMQVIDNILRRSAALLPRGGKFITSYRDLSEERKGTDRFFLVKSDAGRVLSCFLEYFPGKVMVHDIILEYADGEWTQTVGSYPKLRIPVSTLRQALQKNAFTIEAEETVRGMHVIVAVKN